MKQYEVSRSPIKGWYRLHRMGTPSEDDWEFAGLIFLASAIGLNRNEVRNALRGVEKAIVWGKTEIIIEYSRARKPGGKE